MCSINAEAYQNCLVLCNESTLTIGAMDQIQKLHIRTIHLYETPHAMAFQKETQTYGLLTKRHDKRVSGRKDSLKMVVNFFYSADDCNLVGLIIEDSSSSH